MKTGIVLTSLGLALVCIGCSKPDSKSEPQHADIVLVSGQVRTPDGWTEALAISGEKIVAVGSDEDIVGLVGDSTVVVELDGRTVLPGFHDSHVHPLYGGMMHSGADHTNCKIAWGSTLEVLQDALSECVQRITSSEWVTGGQWDASAIGGVPDKTMIDGVSPDTPVLLNDTSGHSAWANSKALEMAGVTRDTPDPQGGIIERDTDGNPTGILREGPAIFLVREHVPPPSDQVIREALEWSLETMASYGITSFTEASNGFVAGSAREAGLYAELADDGVLHHRVRICMNWAPDSPADPTTEVIENRAQYHRERVTPDCVKLFLDGVPTDSHTAAMLEPYVDTMDGRDDEASRYGMLLIEQDVTNELVTRFDLEGLTVKFHAAGDAAVRAGLDAIEAARTRNGDSRLRHNVGHVTFIAEEDVARAKDLNATLELSPYLWSPSPTSDDVTKAIGQERIDRIWPFREVIDAGGVVVAGSDWSVVPSVNPWIAIESLVTRENPGGSEKSFGKRQIISVEEAIDLFTVNAAEHMNKADSLGRLQPGFLADLVVIDQNPYTVSATNLHRIRVLMTFVNGEKIFDGM